MTPNSRLAEARKVLRIKQKEMALLLNMRPTSYNHIERGRNKVSPRISLLLKLRFGISEDWLFKGEGDMFVHQPRSYSVDSTDLPLLCEDLVAYSAKNNMASDQPESPKIHILQDKNKELEQRIVQLQAELRLLKNILAKLTG